MKSESERYVILFNGEIYNFLELKKRFNLFTKTNSDTEVILQLFEKFGSKMVNMLEGMFSIIIYDQKKMFVIFLEIDLELNLYIFLSRMKK